MQHAGAAGPDGRHLAVGQGLSNDLPGSFLLALQPCARGGKQPLQILLVEAICGCIGLDSPFQDSLLLYREPASHYRARRENAKDLDDVDSELGSMSGTAHRVLADGKEFIRANRLQ